MRARDRRALVLGAAITGLAWFGLRGVPTSWARLQEIEASTEQQLDLLERAHSRVSRVPELDRAISELASIADSLPAMLLAGPDANGAEVDLMARVRAMAAAEPVRIRGFEPTSGGGHPGALIMVVLIVDVETDLAGLLNFLERIELCSAALAVEAVDIHAREPHSDQLPLELLDAKLTVSGWFRAEGARPDPSSEVEG